MRDKLLESAVVVLATSLLVKAAIAVSYYAGFSLPLPYSFKGWVNAGMMLCSAALALTMSAKGSAIKMKG